MARVIPQEVKLMDLPQVKDALAAAGHERHELRAEIEQLQHLLADTREELNLKDEAIAVLSEDRDAQHAEIQRLRDTRTVVIDIPGRDKGTGTFYLKPGQQHVIDRSRAGFDAIVTALVFPSPPKPEDAPS